MSAVWGKASRDIQREGARARARREQRVDERRSKTRSADWEDERGEEAPCSACGHDDDVASMFTASTGLVCASCFAADEGKIAKEPVPEVWQLLVRPAMYSPTLLPLFVYATSGVNLWSSVGWLGDLVMLIWICGLGGLVGWVGFLGLGVVETIRQTVRRTDLTQDERRQLIAGQIWHWVGLLGFVVGGFASGTWLANL